MKEHRYLRLTSQLARVPFLAHLDQQAIDNLTLDSVIVECGPGETLLSEGKEENHFLVLLKGAVEVLKDGKVVGVLEETGEILGEQALLNRTRSATVRAQTRVFAFRVDGHFVESLTHDQRLVYEAELYKFLAHILAKRLDRTSERLAELERVHETPE